MTLRNYSGNQLGCSSEPVLGLVKNHKICDMPNWTRRGTDDFLGSVKRTWGRALSIPPKAQLPGT